MKSILLLINAVLMPSAYSAGQESPAAHFDFDHAEADEMDEYFLGRGRSLWTKSTTSNHCEQCLSSGKKHCWRKRLDYSGYWT